MCDKLTTGHSHGQQSGLEAKEVKMQLLKGRFLTCKSCGQDFDTKDPVVLHLLRQNRKICRTMTCPFCEKVLMESKNTSAVKANPSIPSRVKVNQRENSGTPFHQDFSNKNAENSSLSKPVSSSVHPPTTRLQNKRKLSSSSASNEPKKLKLTNSIIPRHSESSSSEPLLGILIPPQECKPQLQMLSSHPFPAAMSMSQPTTPSTPLLAQQAGQVKLDYEITYRQPRGKGSRGGMSGRRTSGGSSKSSGNEDSQNASAPSPLAVSVLINNNPFPSATRLAVPKGREFKKGQIRCPYCGFEAKSVREVQFHVNTHMAKSYPCEFCPKIYRSKQAVINHTEKYHSANDAARNITNRHFATANNGAMGGTEKARELEDDQQSMSNYSSSMASDGAGTENYFCDVSQSLDSNLENSNNCSFTQTSASYHDPAVQDVRFPYGGAYFTSATGGLVINQPPSHELVLVGGGGRDGNNVTYEKVLEIANF